LSAIVSAPQTRELFALSVLGERRRLIAIVPSRVSRQIHPHFVLPGVSRIWKMQEDLSAPYPGYGLGTLDPSHGYVVYRLLGERELAGEIRDIGRSCAGSIRISTSAGISAS
jgi:hypothetical protein